MRPALRYALVLLSAAALQRGLFAELRLGGVALDVFLLLAVAAGIAVGPERGAVLGFFAGLTLDLIVQTPLGLGALTGCLAGFVAGRLHGSNSRASRWLRAILVAGVSAWAVGTWAVVAELIGQEGSVTGDLLWTMAVVAVLNAVLAPVAVRVLRWVEAGEDDLRPVLR